MAFKREREQPPLAKRLMAEIIIVVCLFPILLGAISNMQTRYRVMWDNMRREHREALARQEAHRHMRESPSSTGVR